MPENTSSLDIWAKVELFGHNSIVGHCTETSIAGSCFLRVDVPSDDGEGIKLTRFFHGNAVYGISPIGKELAVEMARGSEKAPIQPYDVPALQEKIRKEFVPRLPATASIDHRDDRQEDDDDTAF